jgi:hypothetical protein
LPGLRTPLLSSTNAAPVRVLLPFAGESGENLLLAAGQFSNLEGTPASSIAVFDGSAWSNALPLPGRLANATVDAAAQFDGAWHVGGTLTGETGSLDVLRWTGDAWGAIGAELAGGTVRCMLVLGTELFIGGDFATSQQRDGTRGLVRFDGTSVLPAGTGLESGGVRAMVVHDGLLHVGGSMPGGAMTWDSLAQSLVASPGLGAGDVVRGFAVLGGQLHAAGSFGTAGGAVGLARWDGAAWSPVLSTPASGPTQAIVAHADELVLAGTQSFAGLPNATRVYAWNGSSWRALSDTSDTSEPLGVLVQDAGWVTLASYGGVLLAAGHAGYSAPGLPQGRTTLLTHDGARWGVFANGVDGTVSDMTLLDGRVVLGGSFRVAGGRRANGVAAWDGTRLVPLGSGPLQAGGVSTAEAVLDMHVHEGVLHAGGQMQATTPTGQLGGVARWTGTAWVRTVPGTTGNPSAQVLQLHTHEGQLFAATNGNVSTSTGAHAGVIRLATGGTSGNWLGTGITTPSTQWTELETLAGSPSPSLVSAGELGGLRQWNGTTTWTTIASTAGIAGRIVDLLAVGSGPVAGLTPGEGLLLLADTPFSVGGVPASSVLHVSSNGDRTVTPLGRISVSLAGSSAGLLAAYQGDVIAGKQFRVDGSATINARLARWNGIAWQPMPQDVLGTPPGGDASLTRVNTMLVQPMPDGSNVLWVGGFFGFAGSTGQPSPYLARYVASAAPVIVQQPVSTLGCPGTEVSFQTLANVSEGVTFRWRRDGVLLSDGALANVGTIAGATTSTLRITGLLVGAPGSYTCIVTSACGTTVSEAATLTLRPPAPTLLRQPAGAMVCPLETLELSVQAPAAAAQYEWRLNGQALGNGPREGGAVVSGADTPALRIESLQASETGEFKCFVFNDCGFVLSERADVVLRSACCDSIDFNNDQLFPADEDLIDLLRVLAGDTCETCNDIDFNNDGLFPDDGDLVTFLRVVAGGSCG